MTGRLLRAALSKNERNAKMANISSAYGSMTLKGAWMPAAIKTLNTIAREIWATWSYGVQLDDFDEESNHGEQTATFYGSGRWAFNSNLECLGRWTTEEITGNPALSAMYNDLMMQMHANGLTIEVSYSDEEGGCQVLYNQTGILSSNGTTLVYEVTFKESVDYNWENFMKVTGDTDLLDELVYSLCKQIGVEDDDDGHIERWAIARTNPHCSDFNQLNEDLQEEFERVFQKKTLE
jgi:hypothetical protein